ncbi:helix-turn-helix transcriptional regulator [Pseudomonas putida]|uniref:Helix-turn-helix transcriptional regulator n=1 Tax=Pseudomonas putida TaxID=303 RepID=A0A7W2QL24_PSEPU|nr:MULTISPECIES: helix-turn-helix transcriptional regulator [Pseudomonas]MBA6118588.1 helix-turn-helix transcriptional regulator [Pseudomonas putida]MBI6941777.1 helix-turn-helix transcriptional regulator [Pseudomonas putida]MBI6958036.1 helix-turn-helix transcriptional regulator [Pseudomonas putida]MCZ9639814.1 ArsR family transcriptional regulator [Pseudomonas putida]MEC4875626.1 ArsR family transcriptional regulator [Pseudomonas sp. NC26]
MNAVSSISQIAGLMADPKRSAMLWALIDGTPRPTDELAMITGLTSSSACAHLSLLSSAGLLRLEARGRKRYFRLATPQVGAAVEALASVQLGSDAIQRPAPLQMPMSMRRARRCGEHLGGELASELYHRLVAAGWLEGYEGRLMVTEQGRRQLASIGVYIDALAPQQQRGCVICHCSEWSDQGPHLGGSLGQALLKLFLQSGWIRESQGTRALQISAEGVQQINRIARVEALQVG